ncbi:group-specific protein [Paenibacillus vini]|uniref:PARP catalytic domain-containing protein n=1 Tax=Paenibacillus vini TaxID=1476024 RepID=A0ABQ4MAQ5_9BACL|nr:group-specific protein [Paenibacillus vini]GIP53003.1 hypothetical protein J42TS3_20380 [Paenibacillus vini]
MQIQNPFVIESDAPYSLNYLVYIQNAYLNSKSDESINPKFPYIDVSKWALIDDELFLIRFNEIWEQVLRNIATNGHFDHNAVLTDNKALFRPLFQTNLNGETGYSESIKSFSAWWNGLAGRIAVEHFLDNQIFGIYQEMSQTIKKDKHLKISLVYDKFPLGRLQILPWCAVLPIEDIFQYKKNKDIIPMLLSCCNQEIS